MKIVAMIPARMAATRFPNKPLASILGLPMIEHVRRRVSLNRQLAAVIVATCDQEIREAVEAYGGRVIMTADSHERCTDRIAEAAAQIEADIIINVQGDEPLVMPEMLDEAVAPLLAEQDLPAVNLATRITDMAEFTDPNAPKIVTDIHGNILYISREPIPSGAKYDSDDYLKLKQLGLIAFRKDFLVTFARLTPTPLEIIESVDMNRALEHGYKVRAVITENRMIGVDLPGDIQRVEQILRQDRLLGDYM